MDSFGSFAFGRLDFGKTGDAGQKRGHTSYSGYARHSNPVNLQHTSHLATDHSNGGLSDSLDGADASGFEPNDKITWESVKNEVTESVKRWATNINLNDIQIVKNEEDESEIYVRLDYSVSEGNKVTNDSVVVQV